MGKPKKKKAESRSVWCLELEISTVFVEGKGKGNRQYRSTTIGQVFIPKGVSCGVCTKNCPVRPVEKKKDPVEFNPCQCLVLDCLSFRGWLVRRVNQAKTQKGDTAISGETLGSLGTGTTA